MAIPQEELKTLLQSDSPNTDEVDLETLKSIAATQQDLSKLKRSMNSLLDSILQNQSMITKAANYWGELSLLQRLIGGVAVVVPTLAAGMAAHATVLVTLGGVSMASYAFGGIVLDEHHEKHISNIEQIKSGVFSFVNLLDVTITALENIRIKFSNEIEKFKIQNSKLSETIYQLTQEMDSLSNQVEVFIDTERMLGDTVKELEQRNLELKASSEQNSQQLEANQIELTKVKKAYETSQTQLSDKIIELSNARTTLGLETDKARKIAATLQGTVQTLAGTVIGDSSQRHVFQERLDNFLTSKEASFDQVADRISNAERELAVVTEELKLSNLRYTELQDMQEKLLKRLEKIELEVIAEQTKPNTKFGALLSSKGFYGLKRVEEPMIYTPPSVLAM